MTDKQIIIDRVDVSGCDFLNKTRHCKAHISIMGTDTNKCKCFSNCHFKRLKRKEQECEELKAKIKYMEEYIKTVENARNEFEKESKFLKEEIQKL